LSLIYTLSLHDALPISANLLGIVTVADVYAFVDRNLAPWDQRPLFKCNLSRLTPLRKCDPIIDTSTLRLLPEYFESPDEEYSLEDRKSTRLNSSHDQIS